MGAPTLDELLKQAIDEHGQQIIDDLDLQIVGLDFLERLLIGLIWANPINNKPNYSNEQRLADALRAIVGYTIRQRSDEIVDDIALLSMAHMKAGDNYKKLQDKQFKVRSIRELARIQAAHWAEGSNSEEAAFHRLRRKFAKREKDLLQKVDDKFLAINTLQQFALDEIEERLKIFGVGFHSYD